MMHLLLQRQNQRTPLSMMKASISAWKNAILEYRTGITELIKKCHFWINFTGTMDHIVGRITKPTQSQNSVP